MSYPYSNIVHLATGAASAKRTLCGNSKKSLITATKDCYIEFNVDSTSAAKGYYIKAGEQYVFDIMYPTKIAAIQSSEAGSVSIMEFGDKVIIITEKATFVSDANLQGPVVTTVFSGDTYFHKEYSATYNGDSSLKKVLSGTMTGDANIYKAASSTSITGDTNLMKRNMEATLKADAFIAAGDRFMSNANLVGTEEATFKGDANLLDDRNVGTFQADAVLITF
jgi:hypothetical protein